MTDMPSRRLLLVFVSLTRLLSVHGLSHQFCDYDNWVKWEYSLDNGEVIIVGCTILPPVRRESVIVPQVIDGMPVTRILDMKAMGFDRKDHVTMIVLPEKIRQVMQGAFADFRGLQKFIVSERNACYQSVSNLLCSKDGQLLICCPPGSRGEVFIPEKVRRIRTAAFVGCYNIHSLQLSSQLECLDDFALSDCRNLTSICVDKRNVRFTSENGILYSENGTKLVVFPPGKKDCKISSRIREIGVGAMSHCNSVKTIRIPNGVMGIGYGAFAWCSELQEVSFASTITNIADRCLFSCPNLCLVNVPEGVNDIGVHAFARCTNLKRIVLPTSLKRLGMYAFYGCTNLKSIEFRGDAPSVTSFPSILMDTPDGLRVLVHEQTRGWEVNDGWWPQDRKVNRRQMVILPPNRNP